jgi:hypothetical protein
MTIQKGDTVFVTPEFYLDPYCLVPAIQGYDDLDRLYYVHYPEGDDIDFSAWFKRLTFEVTLIDGEFIHAKTEMLFEERTFIFYRHEVDVDEAKSAMNRVRKKNKKLERAGQMKLFGDDTA